MRCEEVGALWADRLAGRLDAEAEQRLREHIGTCPSCRAELPDLEALWHAVRELPPLAVPSDRMRDRFVAMLARQEPSTSTEPPGPTVHQMPPRATAASWRMSPPVQMAVAASLLIAGILIGRGFSPAPGVTSAAPPADIAEVRSELRDLRQMLTLSLLQQQSASERLRGVSWTGQLDQPGNEIVAALLDTLLHDTNDNVRLAAVDALRRFSDRDDVRLATVRAAGDPSSPMLQIAAIDFIADVREPSAEPLLRRLAQDPTIDESVRGRAAAALARLSS